MSTVGCIAIIRSTYIFVCERSGELRLRTRELGLALEHLESNVDLVLLQTQLCKRRDSGVRLRIYPQSLTATLFCSCDVLLELKQRKALVD